MSFRTLLISTLLAVAVAACGGGGSDTAKTSITPKYAAKVKANAVPVVFSGARGDYVIKTDLIGISVTEVANPSKIVRVASDARLRFSDNTLAIDSLSQGSPGTIFRLYQAAFNRLPDIDGLSFWVSQMDQEGYWIFDIANSFIASAEFKQVYGANPTNEEIVKQLYRNVLQREGETSGVAFWVDVLTSKRGTLADVLLSFTESAENIYNSQNWVQLQGGVKLKEPGVTYQTFATANPGAARSVSQWDLITLDGTASTVGTDKTKGYKWAIVNKPIGSFAKLYASTTANPYFVADVVGKYELLLLANDGTNESVAASQIITATAPVPGVASSAAVNYVYVSGATGSVANGKTVLHTSTDSTFTVTNSGNQFSIIVAGDYNWSGLFVEGSSHTVLDAATFTDVQRAPFHNAVKGGMDWSGNGSGCNTSQSTFVVDNVTYLSGALKSIDITFTHRCSGGNNGNVLSSPTYGKIHWTAP